MKLTTFFVIAGSLASSSAFTIKFTNKCTFTVWPAIGKAPGGHPDQSVKFGTRLDAGASTSFIVGDHNLGIRAWGRTGCDAKGANCATGKCTGGLICTDAGITSNAILSEYGFADFGQFGGERIAWDLSRVDLAINIPTKLVASDGPTALCTPSNCPVSQAYAAPTDFGADRNSRLGTTFEHIFCP